MIIRKKSIKKRANPRKKAKGNNFTDVEKISPKETPPTFLHTVDYEGDTNKKTHGSDYSPSETDSCVRNMAKEHEKEEDEESKEDTSEINDTNESKLSKYKTKESLISSLLDKHFSLKVIQAVIFSIVHSLEIGRAS